MEKKYRGKDINNNDHKVLRRKIAETEETVSQYEESKDDLRTMMNLILDAIPHAVFGLKKRQIIFANRAVEDVFGWQTDEIIGQNTRVLYRTDEEYEEIANRFYPVLKQQRTHIDEFPCRHKDGRDIICRVSTSSIGKFLKGKMIVATYEDITARKRAEEELKKYRESLEELVGKRTKELKNTNELLQREIIERKQAEDLYKTLAEKSFAGVFIVQDGKFCFLNTRAITYAGYTSEELLDKASTSIIYPEDIEIVKKMAHDILHGKESKSYEFRVVTKQGQIRWVMQTIASIQYKGKRAILGNAMDITDYKQAEEALQESEEKFRKMSSSAQDAIIMIDDSGNITFWNEAAEKVFGYSMHEALGKECHMLIAPQRYHKAYREGFSKFKKTGKGAAVGERLELEAVRKGGMEFPIELSLSATQLKGKWTAIGIIRDISIRKHAEEETRRREKLQNVLEIAGTICHEMNQPMQIISGYSEFLLMTSSENDGIYGKLDTINKQVHRMSSITRKLMMLKDDYETQDYLGFSRIIDIHKDSEKDT